MNHNLTFKTMAKGLWAALYCFTLSSHGAHADSRDHEASVAEGYEREVDPPSLTYREEEKNKNGKVQSFRQFVVDGKIVSYSHSDRGPNINERYSLGFASPVRQLAFGRALAAGNLHLFALSEDGEVRMRAQMNSGKSAEFSVVVPLGRPSPKVAIEKIAAARGPDTVNSAPRLRLYALGSDGKLYVRTQTGEAQYGIEFRVNNLTGAAFGPWTEVAGPNNNQRVLNFGLRPNNPGFTLVAQTNTQTYANRANGEGTLDGWQGTNLLPTDGESIRAGGYYFDISH